MGWDAVGGRALGGVEHAEAATGARADVEKAAAVANCRYDRIDG